MKDSSLAAVPIRKSVAKVKPHRFGAAFVSPRFCALQLLVKLTGRARDVHAAGNAGLAVFYALHNAGGLSAFGAIRALLCVHDLLAVSGLCNFRHSFLLKSEKLRPQLSAILESTGVGSKTCDRSGRPAPWKGLQAD